MLRHGIHCEPAMQGKYRMKSEVSLFVKIVNSNGLRLGSLLA